MPEKTPSERTLRERLDETIVRAKSKTPCASNYECLLADLMGIDASQGTQSQPAAAPIGGTIGLDGDTKRDWESDGPALEKRALDAEAALSRLRERIEKELLAAVEVRTIEGRTFISFLGFRLAGHSAVAARTIAQAKVFKEALSAKLLAALRQEEGKS